MKRDKPIPAWKYTPSQAWLDRKASGDWAQDWPSESSHEYRLAASIRERAPIFTELGKNHARAALAIAVYSVFWLALAFAAARGWVR